ncbi:alpha/beta fold hydrolase [Vibrio sp.]|uniref:alpha/beta fold hydrolase n=1 Tax=Vibrio sp. TaxID=678 RepID=UPI003AA93D74
MLREREIQLSHLRLSGLEFGQESHASVTLLFLHGWLDNAASFTPIWETLIPIAQQKNWHLLSIDLAGHGLSQHRSSDSFYPFHDYITDIHDLLMNIAPNKCILIGHSLGALIASCYSAAFPDKVQGLIQIEGLGPLSESAESSVDRLRKGVLSRQRIQAKPIRRYKSQHDACLHRMHANQLTDKQLKPLIERGTYLDDGHWYWRYDAKLKCQSIYRMTEAQSLVYLQAIECPNLLIFGDNGFPQFTGAVMRKMALKHCHEVIVQGGHHCHIESFTQVSDLIATFVAKNNGKCDLNN